MADRPLLIFPKPREDRRQIPKPGFAPKNLHFPDVENQKDRLTPKLQEMLDFFIIDAASGLEPEYALVLETVGTIEDFQKAANAVGMEWLAEIESEINPDENFYLDAPKIRQLEFQDKERGISKEKSKEIVAYLRSNGIIDKNDIGNEKIHDKSFLEHILKSKYPQFYEFLLDKINSRIRDCRAQMLGSRLFLGMSNRQCMERVLSLWNQWDSPEKKFPHGESKWKEIFSCLKTIRKWGVEDRLREFGILEIWKEDIEIKRGTSSTIKFEIELWFQKDKSKRNQIQKQIEQLVLSENGKIVTTCMIEDISFHAIKAELPPENIEKVIQSQYTALFKSDDVMLFRPAGQCAVRNSEEDGDVLQTEGKLDLNGKPVVALLDGHPMANHALLGGRLLIDDPDDFGAEYQVSQMTHGTAMASLICHDELDNKDANPMDRPLYVRPIMVPNKNCPGNWEYVPEDIFFEDVIHRSVRRLFDGDREQSPVAPTVKIINLSICNKSQMFFGQMSSCARLIDWLSQKHQVLFCVSAGNITEDIELGDSQDDDLFESENQINRSMLSIIADNRNRRMLSPAESVNAITVGALHKDCSNPEDIGNLTDLLPDSSLPSPITAHGLGFRNAIKPEIYYPGGRQLHFPISVNTYRISDSPKPPGQKVAIPGRFGDVNRTA